MRYAGWTGGLELQVPLPSQHLCSTNQGYSSNLGDLGTSVESGGAAVAKRESYEGGGS